MYLSAASTDMSSSMTSLFGSIRKKPDVGFGVVGTYTLTYSSVRWLTTSPPGVPVRNAIVYEPRRGYSISSALRNALPLLDSSVSDTCLTLV